MTEHGLDLSTSRVLVTGSNGFLGQYMVPELGNTGATVISPPRAGWDLRDPHNVRLLYMRSRPDIVIHLAAKAGGIQANQDAPGMFFHDNLLMGMNVIEQARAYGKIKKLVIVGTVCAYPKNTPAPFQEQDIWAGYPEETNAPYGVAKRALLVMGQAYRQQYGMNIVHVLPANLYGPLDNFDPRTSHVVPALIRKLQDAVQQRADCITLWGTGDATREFLHAEDAAKGIAAAAAGYDSSMPLNLGTGIETHIRDLAAQIAKKSGYAGKVLWDGNKPTGQPRRVLDISRARDLLGWTAKIPLDTGLTQTVHWWSHKSRDLEE